jgi:hypothetical protein
VTAAAAAVAVGCALAAYPALKADRLGWVLAAGGLLAVVPLAGGLALGSGGWIPWAVLGLGTEYAASLFLPEGRVDGGAPLVAAGLLLTAELASWSVELRTPVDAEPVVVARRAALILAAGCAAVPLAAGVLAATALPLGGGVGWDAVGVAAALGAGALLAVLSRSRSRP